MKKKIQKKGNDEYESGSADCQDGHLLVNNPTN